MKIAKDAYCVYKHTFPNGKVYIGITCKKPEYRWDHGKGYLAKTKDGEYTQLAMARAILKYGWENVEHEILFENLSKEEAEQKEIELIAEYKSNKRKFGYNMTIGGGIPNRETKLVYCEETKYVYSSLNDAEKKTGISSTAISKACRDISKTSGKKHWRFISEEEVEKYASRCIDCETMFIRDNLKSTRQTRCQNCRNKHVEAYRRDYYKKRKELGDEFVPKNKRYDRQMTIRCVEANFCYASIREAAKCLGVKHEDIFNAVNNSEKTAGGFHWEIYKNESNAERNGG